MTEVYVLKLYFVFKLYDSRRTTEAGVAGVLFEDTYWILSMDL